MNLDGKAIKPSLADEKTLFYRMPLNSENVLSIGSHSVDVTLADSVGRTASTSWLFTVGVTPIPTQPIPEDAKQIKGIS